MLCGVASENMYSFNVIINSLLLQIDSIQNGALKIVSRYS